jgi:hypothetical protein
MFLHLPRALELLHLQKLDCLKLPQLSLMVQRHRRHVLLVRNRFRLVRVTTISERRLRLQLAL